MITKTYLRHRVDLLNKRLGRPETGWTRANDRSLTANVGHLALEEMSPGDGWTRYRLVEISNVNGAETDRSPSCTAAEMSAFLDGVEAGFDLAPRTQIKLIRAAEWLCALAYDMSQSIYLCGTIEKVADAYHLAEACRTVNTVIAQAKDEERDGQRE